MIFRMRMVGICLLTVMLSVPAWADQQLAKQSQNPIGNLISVPFQNNGYFGIGPSDSSAYVLNIQPVYPVTFGNVNLINRMTLPVIGIQGQDQAPPDRELYRSPFRCHGEPVWLRGHNLSGLFWSCQTRKSDLGSGSGNRSANGHEQ